jgi:hypothetical protein
MRQHTVGKSIQQLAQMNVPGLLGFDPELLGNARKACACLPILALKRALGLEPYHGTRQRLVHAGEPAPQPGYRARARDSFRPSLSTDPGTANSVLTPSSSVIPVKKILSLDRERSIGSKEIERQKTALDFDEVHCINLDRRPDRWERFCGQIPTDWPFAKIQRFPAIDGRQVSPPSWWKAGAGAWGCYRSHLTLIEQAINRGARSVLLFEDDAIFDRDFTSKCLTFLKSLPDDWGMIYLGGQHLKVKDVAPVRINDQVFRPFNVNRTHAYALRGRTLIDVYQHLCRTDWHRNHHIDHHLGLFHQAGQYPVYCPVEWLVGQAAGQSNISGRTHSERFWPAAMQLQKSNIEEQPFLAIVGLHSSGSSCLAGIAYHLGLHLGNRLTGYYGNNPHGSQCGFEATGLRDICEAAIPFPATMHKLPHFDTTRRLQSWIQEKKSEAVGRRTLAAGKYPQLCQLGKELLEICGDQLRVLVSERPIELSIKSLQRRCPRQDPQVIAAHQHWLDEGKTWLLSQIPAQRQLVVHYQDVLIFPVKQARRIAAFLNLDPTQTQLDSIRQWVDPHKEHVREER